MVNACLENVIVTWATAVRHVNKKWHLLAFIPPVLAMVFVIMDVVSAIHTLKATIAQNVCSVFSSLLCLKFILCVRVV